MRVWAYENWQAYGGKLSIVFHLPNCPSCNDGQGIHPGAGDEHGRWLEFDDLAAAKEWASRRRADLVRTCKRCLPTASSQVVATSSDSPGTYRESDGSPVTFAYALTQWQSAARPVLVGVARQYHAVITYAALADAVQETTGIRTRMLLANWIGRVLGAVSADCHRRDEPMLSSLCVHADGGVGPGYADAVIQRYGGKAPADLDRHAAEERLRCYRHFGAALPPGGGEPVLTPQVASRRALARRVGKQLREVCPTCHIQLPFSGQCDFCS